ncbi:DUF3095 family protein [Bradyrhizobium paxllaeri]|uniref:DUF3095 family protein n=1 Tax=Bradyrhizobium paxllaeri TaxID=190148 RepID=UPI000A003ADE
MTVDCSSELADVIDARLEEAQRRGACLFGTHRQLAANLTCFVRSPTQANHVHFVEHCGQLEAKCCKQPRYTTNSCFGCARPTHQTLGLGCLPFWALPSLAIRR